MTDEVLIIEQVEAEAVLIHYDQQGPAGPRGERGEQGPPGEGSVRQFPSEADVALGEVVAMGDAGVRPADLAHRRTVLGVATNSSTAGQIAFVTTHGNTPDGPWSWVPGQLVYLAEPGGMTQTPPATNEPAVVVGVAVTETKIFVDIKIPPLKEEVVGDYHINELLGVDTTGQQVGSLLQYDGVNYKATNTPDSITLSGGNF